MVLYETQHLDWLLSCENLAPYERGLHPPLRNTRITWRARRRQASDFISLALREKKIWPLEEALAGNYPANHKTTGFSSPEQEAKASV